MICPTCSRDVWLYDANTWTCKLGHHTPFDERAPLLKITHRRRSTPYLVTAGASAATVGVIHLLGYLF